MSPVGPVARVLPVAITTSPRLTRYLVQTIESLKASAVAASLEIVVCPNFVDPEEDWDRVRSLIGPAGTVLEPLVNRTLRQHVEGEDSLKDFVVGNNIYASEYNHRGIELNTDRAYREMVRRGHPFFLCLQDDVIFCARAADRMWDIGRREMVQYAQPFPIGAVSFYTPRVECGRSRRDLWMIHGGYYGELAVLWRRAAAEEFLSFSNPSNAHDLEIGRFFEERSSRWRLYGHSPCLAQHVGKSSARGDDGVGHQRETMNFRAGHDAIKEAKPWR